MECSRSQAQYAIVPILSALMVILAPPIYAQEKSGDSLATRLAWEHGPTLARIGGQAQINRPKGYMFINASDARKFLELTENIPSGQELAIIADEKLTWFVIFSFDDVGYVKDDEKDSLDSSAMLKSIQDATEKSNEERK